MRPPSPPKLEIPPLEDQFSKRDARGAVTPERKPRSYQEAQPGVRSSPWREDPQKKKAKERKEREIIEAAEKLRLQQEEIFFRKKKHNKENSQRHQLESSNYSTVSKAKLSRYPNPEDMYKQLREFQEMAYTQRGSSKKRLGASTGRSRSRPKNVSRMR